MENIENKDLLKINEDNKKRIKINKKVLLIIIFALLIFIVLLCRFLIYPILLIKSINNNYDLKQYEKVANYYDKIYIIRKFINNEDEYNIIDYKVKYSKALFLYDSKNFIEAENILNSILTPSKESSTLLNECYYNCALTYIADKDYTNAVKKLELVIGKDDKDSLLDDCYYNIAIELLKNKQFTDSLSMLKKIKNSNYEGLKDTEKKIYYEYGLSSYNSKDYSSAITQFEKIKGYNDVDKYYNTSCIIIAEKYIDSNDLNSAIQTYNKVPDDSEYNEINAGDRKNQLLRAYELNKVMGNKKATSTYIETRNVWKYDGRWDSWYIDQTSNEYIDISLKLNNDGSFDISGKAMFYVYDDFSSLAKYVKTKSKIKTFSFKNVYDIPNETWLDSETKFSYSNGTYKIDYYVEDNYSTNFYNIYKTTITY